MAARNAHSANKRYMCTPFQFGTLRNGASFLGKSANEEPPRHESPINPHEKQGKQRAKRPPARDAVEMTKRLARSPARPRPLSS